MHVRTWYSAGQWMRSFRPSCFCTLCGLIGNAASVKLSKHKRRNRTPSARQALRDFILYSRLARFIPKLSHAVALCISPSLFFSHILLKPTKPSDLESRQTAVSCWQPSNGRRRRIGQIQERQFKGLLRPRDTIQSSSPQSLIFPPAWNST